MGKGNSLSKDGVHRHTCIVTIPRIQVNPATTSVTCHKPKLSQGTIKDNTHDHTNLVGGFNPSEKYYSSQTRNLPPRRDAHQKTFETTTK